jgi:hypothetical protein
MLRRWKHWEIISWKAQEVSEGKGLGTLASTISWCCSGRREPGEFLLCFALHCMLVSQGLWLHALVKQRIRFCYRPFAKIPCRFMERIEGFGGTEFPSDLNSEEAISRRLR